MTIIEGAKTVYLEGSAGHRDAGVKAVLKHDANRVHSTGAERVQYCSQR